MLYTSKQTSFNRCCRIKLNCHYQLQLNYPKLSRRTEDVAMKVSVSSWKTPARRPGRAVPWLLSFTLWNGPYSDYNRRSVSLFVTSLKLRWLRTHTTTLSTSMSYKRACKYDCIISNVEINQHMEDKSASTYDRVLLCQLRKTRELANNMLYSYFSVETNVRKHHSKQMVCVCVRAIICCRLSYCILMLGVLVIQTVYCCMSLFVSCLLYVSCLALLHSCVCAIISW